MAIGTTAAILGAAAIGAAGSAVAGSKNASAIKESTSSSLAAQQAAIASQEKLAAQNQAFLTDVYNQNAMLQADAFNRSAGIQTQAGNIGFNALNPAVQAGNVARTGYMGLLGYKVPQGQTNPYKTPDPITAPVLQQNAMTGGQ